LIAIKNGRIVTPDRIIEDKILLLDRDVIFGFSDGLERTEAVERLVDAQGRYILPGLIDVHSDKIEQYIQPRPTSQMDFEFALRVCERDLLSAGITTMYHALSLFKDEIFGRCLLRSRENMEKIADLIAGLQLGKHLIRHRLHLRIELDNPETFDSVREMLRSKKAQLISFMDHSPGQGQYADLAIYHDTVSKYKGKEISALGFAGVLEYHKNKEFLSLAQLRELAECAHEHGIAVASHDDDTEEKLALNRDLGVDLSEFPISLDTAKSAKSHGFYTVVGAANILRGGSHSGNLSAAEAVLEDCADILCSDYYPAAILHSIFRMHMGCGVPLPAMVNRATLNPAKAVGTDRDYGSVEPGKKADLLIVDILDGYPVVTLAFVDGRETYRVEYRS
jgi:alpha-D-ribose 1-methylphosphonate 5-triphosphate diphosphatase